MGDLRSGNEGVGARSLPRSKATSWDVAGRNHEAERGPRQVDNPPEAKGRDDQRPDSRVHEGLCTLGQESVVQIQGLRAQGHHVSCPHGLGRPAASPGAGSTRPCSPAGTGTSAGHTGWRRTSRRIPACTYLNTIHKVLMGEDMAEVQPKKSGRRRRVRYERTYSNSMWHTDYNLLDDGRWFIVYMDDASRCITGFGVFDAATGRHALDVLGRAMEEHGIPASILTDRGAQLCQRVRVPEAGPDGVRKGAGPAGHTARGGPHQPPADQRQAGEVPRGAATQAARVHRRITPQDRPRSPAGRVGDIFHPSGPTDPVARLIKWHNHDRRHMSPKKRRETPAQAFQRKMPPPGAKVVTDKQTGEQYRVR